MMSVYVDELHSYGKGPISLRHGSCHMAADILEELHAMADKIGIQRRWFQNDPRHPHYDLAAKFRDKAVRAGAIEVSGRELLAVWIRHRRVE